jgi:hypothetical protein
MLRPGVTNFVHIGLVVEDLDETVGFLALLGFDCGEPGVFSGEWIDRIIGLENVMVEVVMARAPDGTDVFEVVRFQSPSAGAQEPAPAANRPGLRHIARAARRRAGLNGQTEPPTTPLGARCRGRNCFAHAAGQASSTIRPSGPRT